MSWDGYLNTLLAEGNCESAYLLDMTGNICATSLPIKEMPAYEIEVENQEGVMHKTAIYQKNNLLEGLQNNGRSTHPAGIRIYNQKYVTVSFDKQVGSWYLKKEGGGACVCWSSKVISIGTYNTSLKNKKGTTQTAGDCNKVVQTLAKTLKGLGY